MGVFPKMLYNATGWPTAITASAVIKATSHSTGQPPVPTRCSRVSGVNCWGLGFEEEPSTLAFTALFDGEHYEIILAKVDKNVQEVLPNERRVAKGKGQGKGQKGPAPVDDELKGRVTALEARFGTLEKRQDGSESKLQTGFDSVQSQLRQVLTMLQPRPADHLATGMTPPPKQPRTE